MSLACKVLDRIFEISTFIAVDLRKDLIVVNIKQKGFVFKVPAIEDELTVWVRDPLRASIGFADIDFVHQVHLSEPYNGTYRNI